MPEFASALLPRPVPPSSPTRGGQASLFCLRCGTLPAIAGFCRPCCHQAWHSRHRFGGNRELALTRDGGRCRACGFDENPVLHHRRPGEHADRLLITLCRGCHARVHRLAALRCWVPALLALLWEEQHPGVPRQEQFSWEETG